MNKKKILKEHKGLYLCPPNNHGIQTKISDLSSKDTLHKEGWEGSLYPLCKKEK